MIPASLKRFLRAARRDNAGRIVIGARQIYILPTRFGLMYAALVIAMLTGSINYANNLGYLMTFLLAGLGVVAILQTWRNLLKLEISLLPSEPVFAGDKGYLNVRISNHNRQTRGAIQLRADIKGATPDIQDIRASASRNFRVPLPTQKRGWLEPERLILSTQYPLGLLRAWVYLYSGSRLLVFPRPLPGWLAPQTPQYSPSSEGDRGIGADDFVAHRPFRDGDSPRHIDWKIFAREKGLMAKQFGGDRSHRIMLSPELIPEADFENMLRALTRAVLDLEQQQVEYGLSLSGNVIAISHGEHHQQRCLTALALAE